MPGHSTVIHNVARWLDPHPWPLDEPVAVTFSPGDLTCYALLFTPGQNGLVSPGEYDRFNRQPTIGLLAGTGGTRTGVLVRTTTDSTPHPEYVAEKFGTTNVHTVTAVGVIWSLMAGNNPDEVADWYNQWPNRTGIPSCAEVIAFRWTEFHGRQP